MAETAPDFRVRTPAIDPMAFANVLQRKAQIESQQQQFAQEQKDKRVSQFMDAIIAGQKVASNMMDLAQKRTQSKGLQDLTNLISEPSPQPPTPTASSTELPEKGTFNVAPSPEQIDTYSQSLQDRKNALTSALIKANPEKATEYASKMVFGAPKPEYLESKQVLHNGQPIEALFDKTTGNFFDASTKQQLTGKITPYSQQVPTDLTDEDRKRLTPIAKLVLEGKGLPSTFVSSRGNEKEKLSLIATELAAKQGIVFDPTTVPQRIALRKDFTEGTSAKGLKAFNTAIVHSEMLGESIDKLDNSKFRSWNKIANKAELEVGHPELAQFRVIRNTFADEMAKAAQGGSGVITEEERKRQLQAFDSAASPAQMKAVVDSAIKLMVSKTAVLKESWTKTMGDATPATPFITSPASKILKKHGINPDTLETTTTNPQDEANNFLKGLGI